MKAPTEWLLLATLSEMERTIMAQNWIEEDEGSELIAKKPTLEQLENEVAATIKAERKENIKKAKRVSKYIILGMIVVFVGVVVGIIIYKPKFNRELPFEAVSSDNAVTTLGEKDYQEGEYHIDEMNDTGLIVKDCNILQTPSTYGYIAATVEMGEEVTILGEVYENETDDEIKYVQIRYKDIEGFVNKENIDFVWFDSCDLVPIKETDNEVTLEEENNAQEQSDAELLESLQQIQSDTKELQDNMREMNEEIQQRIEAQEIAALLK